MVLVRPETSLIVRSIRKDLAIYGIRKHHSQLKRPENMFKNQYTDSFDSSGNISNENLLLLYKNMLLVDDDSILTIIIIAIDHVFVRYMKLRFG